MSLLSKSYKLLEHREKKLLTILLIFVTISMLLEVISVGAVIPIISSLLNKNEFSSNSLDFIYKYFFFHQLIKYNLIYLVFGLITIFAIKNFFIFSTFWFRSFLLNGISKRLSSDVFKNYLYMPYERITQKKTSEMINNSSEVVETLKESFNNMIIVVSEIIVFLGLIIFLILMEPFGVTLILSLAIFVSYFFYILNKSKLTEWGKGLKLNKEEKMQTIIQSLNSIKIIKILNNYKFFTNLYNVFNFKEHKHIHYSSLVSVLPRFIFEILGISVIGFSIIFFTKQNMSNEEIIIILSVFAVASLRILPAVARITNSIALLRFYKFSIDVVYGELSKKEQHEISNEKYKPIKFKNLKLKKISFLRNSNKKLIVNLVDFDLTKGDSVGIKGLSGSGKTTFIDILCGLLKPTNGKIILNDEIDITNYEKTTPIKIGYIPQDIYLSNNSIASNIAFGFLKEKIEYKKVVEIMKLCKLENFLNNNDKILDVSLGDGGVNLSGGEKQRIGIARALYNNPELLIFDEFTNSLDEQTEKTIISNIDYVTKNKTSIFISHKDSSLIKCKKIYEFKHNQLYNIR
jgi:ABC-type multidrug transport system fused ATPase/permease subunit|tara:strand:- start:620 stop:2341 length:1722 start_codon:yes stop_codon:yes gene_type:complete